MAAIEQTSKAGLTAAEKGVLYAVLAHLTWGAMAVYFGFMSPYQPGGNRRAPRPLVHSLCRSDHLVAGSVQRCLAGRRSRSAISPFSPSPAPSSCSTGASTSGPSNMGRTLESSLGYYINPLLNVVMGYLFLGERFTRLQLVALLLALVAVLIQTFAAGVFPWLGLMLATTFCLYGFLRKTIAVGPTQGFFIEVCIIAIPLLLMQFWLADRSEAHFGGTISDTLLLMGCGLMTTRRWYSLPCQSSCCAIRLPGCCNTSRPPWCSSPPCLCSVNPWTAGSSCPSSSCGLALRSIPGRRSATNEAAAAKRKHWFREPSGSAAAAPSGGCWPGGIRTPAPLRPPSSPHPS